MSVIVGRSAELETLEGLFNSKQAEFLAIYGRRRIGKTYLIRNFFINKDCCFLHTTGLKDGSTKDQLMNFGASLRHSFYQDLETPSTWMQAFEILTNAINEFANNKTVIIFIDELPWMSTPKSRLLQAIDYYWNTKWVYTTNIKLIICGSAAAWMLDNIVNAKGGLHNRLTKKIQLRPFNIGETKQFLQHLNIKLNNDQILEIYMCIGGIPFYLKELKPGLSARQNISKICFDAMGILYSEYDNLLASLFKHSDIYEELLLILSKYTGGLDKKTLAAIAKKSSLGGRLSKRLDELEHAGFIKKFVPYTKKVYDVYYKLIDEYTLFYLKWILPNKSTLDDDNAIMWEQLSLGSGYNAWSGYAFEAICYKHIGLIRKHIQLDRISAKTGTWRYVPGKGSKAQGAQIDLIFDRIDKVVSLCEIKFCNNDFTFDKKVYNELLTKQSVFVEHTKIHKQIFWCLITTKPVIKNDYYDQLIVHNVIFTELY